MYLQLADNRKSWYDYSQSLAETNPEELYIYVPHDASGETGVYVREDYFDNLPDAEWQATMEQLAPYQDVGMSGIFSGIRERISARKERRAERQETRQQKRLDRAGTGLFGGKLKSFIGGLIPGGEPQPIYSEDRGGITGGVQFGAGEVPFYKKPAFIIGSLLVVGTTVVLLARSKKK